MSRKHKIITLVIAASLAGPAMASAGDIGFTYIEGGIVGGFVNDIETSGAVTGGGPLDLESVNRPGLPRQSGPSLRVAPFVLYRRYIAI